MFHCPCPTDKFSSQFLQHIGYPIANDPFYGPKSSFTGRDATVELKDVRLGADFTEECQKQRFAKLTVLPTDKAWIDPKCPECWIDFTDPLPEDMRIDLHAWKYEGPGWKFETDLPVWAKNVTLPVSPVSSAASENPAEPAIGADVVSG